MSARGKTARKKTTAKAAAPVAMLAAPNVAEDFQHRTDLIDDTLRGIADAIVGDFPNHENAAATLLEIMVHVHAARMHMTWVRSYAADAVKVAGPVPTEATVTP